MFIINIIITINNKKSVEDEHLTYIFLYARIGIKKMAKRNVYKICD